MEQLEAFRANGEVVVAFLASDEYTCPAIQNGMTRLLDITFQTPSQFLVSYSICWGMYCFKFSSLAGTELWNYRLNDKMAEFKCMKTIRTFLSNV